MCQNKLGHARVSLADVDCDLVPVTVPGISGVKDDFWQLVPQLQSTKQVQVLSVTV